MSKTIEARYKLLTEYEKILIRPSRYLGPIESDTKERFIFDDKTKMMEYRNVTSSPALLKMFDEIISNSVDASTRKELTHLNEIRVTVQPLTGLIMVGDNGGIPVAMHKEHDMYVPELIFGNLHSGENFDDDEDSTATGQNGEGAGLVNIFSTFFKVHTSDGKKSFVKTWKNNMKDIEKERISKSKSQCTTVSFIPDFERLGCKVTSDDNMMMIKQRVMEVAACNPHLDVYFNNEKFSFSSFKDFVKLFQSDFVYIENEDWKVAIAASDTGTMEHVSFVNSTNTRVGGTHVHYIANQLIDDIRAHIKKKYKHDIWPAEIKNQFRIFIEAKIINPRYDSQTKVDLVTLSKNFKTNISITDAFIKKVIGSNVLVNMINWLEAKQSVLDTKECKRNDEKNKRTVVSGHLPANSVDIEKRILHITEGLSAISNLINVRDPDLHGGYPLKGKFLNTRELSATLLMGKDIKGEFKNKEVAELMAVVGLNSDGSMNLNYGTIAIMADADTDGNCIVGQLLNFFSRWPQLFKGGRIKILITPIVIATLGKVVKRFYEYNDFLTFESDGYTIEYLKGLGSLSESEYDRAVNEPYYLTVDYDDKADSTLDLTFNKGKNKDTNMKYADERKHWLLNQILV